MSSSWWPHVGTVLKMNALNFPERLGWEDPDRAFTFREWNERACRLANGLRGLGVGFQETFGVLSYNRGEWMDLYASCAKGGQVIVPVMFRLAGAEIEYIVNHSECRALVVEAPFVELVNGIRDRLQVPENGYVFLGDGPAPEGYVGFEELLAGASTLEPGVEVRGGDAWNIMYTSGTTGRAQGGGPDP